MTKSVKTALNLEKAGAIETSFTTQITLMVQKLVEANPDRSNSGKFYGEAFIWALLMRLAEKKKDLVWEKMIEQGLVSELPTDPGLYELGMSPRFTAIAIVSDPVRRFNEDELCRLLSESKYKIPAPIAKEFVAKAKKATKSSVTKKIIERGV